MNETRHTPAAQRAAGRIGELIYTGYRLKLPDVLDALEDKQEQLVDIIARIIDEETKNEAQKSPVI